MKPILHACTLITMFLVSGFSSVRAWSYDSSTSWWCARADGTPCTFEQLAAPETYRQILVFPTGFTSEDDALFREEFARLVRSMTEVPVEVYSSKYREQLLYIAQWIPGGSLDSGEAIFGASVHDHPIRGKALTLNQASVHEQVTRLKEAELPELEPWGVVVLFNTLEEDVTANASPPSFIGRRYGIAKFTRADLEWGYIPMHEVAHAALNFLDEYVEQGLEAMSIGTLDHLTPLALFGKGWRGFTPAVYNLLDVYDYRISDILAANGNDNIDVTRFPSRVRTPGYMANEYEYEGGMFFGFGTFHDRGANIMNSKRVKRGPDDEFGYAHSRSQLNVLEQVFENPSRAGRPNDRLRNAGPMSSWPAWLGLRPQLLLFDADKHHRYHPTLKYDVQVGWYEREWKVCRKYKVIPYPCYKNKWVTAQKRIEPETGKIVIKGTKLYGLAAIMQKIACRLGYDEIKQGDGVFKLCEQSVDEMADAFLPTLEFPVPYQNVSVPAPQWFTTYFWRFRSDNGTYRSGWTAWGKFNRKF